MEVYLVLYWTLLYFIIILLHTGVGNNSFCLDVLTRFSIIIETVLMALVYDYDTFQNFSAYPLFLYTLEETSNYKE